MRIQKIKTGGGKMNLVLAGFKFGIGMFLGVNFIVCIIAAICWGVYSLYELWIDYKYLKKHQEDGKNAV